MWEPAFGTGNNLRPRFRYRSHRASFPQRTRNSAHFGANVVVGGCTRPKCAFPETRAERTLLQIVVQSRFFHSLPIWFSKYIFQNLSDSVSWKFFPELNGENALVLRQLRV